MKKVITLVFLAALAILALSASIESDKATVPTFTDIYSLKMSVRIPRVYDNMESNGYRKYHVDTLIGELRMTYPADGSGRATLSVENLYNKSHKVGGEFVTYESYIDADAVFPRVNLIGSNKTGIFKKPSVVFALVCDPSYNIGEVTEDNTLYITLSGTGGISKMKRKNAQVIKSLSGYLAGIIGCGCSEYGHTSPTRVNGAFGPISDAVDDVAAVWGQWRATYQYSICD